MPPILLLLKKNINPQIHFIDTAGCRSLCTRGAEYRSLERGFDRTENAAVDTGLLSAYELRAESGECNSYRQQRQGSPRYAQQQRLADRQHEKKSITISYDVKADRKFVASSFVDTTHAYLTPAGIFMYANDNISMPVRVTILPNKSSDRIATGLEALTQSSYETWSDGPFGQQGEEGDRSISYYDKGPVVGLLFDIAIRKASANKKSLDDVMRFLYYNYYKKLKRGFTDAEFQAACENAAG